MINININKNSTQSGRKERPEGSADTKLFFDDVYKSDTRGKKQQVDVLQYGRSMIEMLGVLAIVGVLSVGGIAGYSKAMEKFKINKTANQVSQIVANIRTLYAQQTTYEGLNTINAIKMGIIPDELGTGETLSNAFGGIVEIAPCYNNYRSSVIYGGAFKFRFTGLSKEACISLATYDWGTAYSSGLYLISAGGNLGNQFDSIVSSYVGDKYESDGKVTYGSNYTPIPVHAAAKACNCPDNTCEVIWKFK